MDSGLIVSGTSKGTAFIQKVLQSSGCAQIAVARSGSEARRLLIENEYDLVVINAPLGDEYGHELAMSVAGGAGSGVLLIVKAEAADEISSKVEESGVFVVPKPISTQLFFQSVKLVEATRRRMLGLRSENSKLKRKIEDIKLADRAKCALIQYLGMTEAQAHRYIEKQAMDLRLTRREVAQRILNTYES